MSCVLPLGRKCVCEEGVEEASLVTLISIACWRATEAAACLSSWVCQNCCDSLCPLLSCLIWMIYSILRSVAIYYFYISFFQLGTFVFF